LEKHPGSSCNVLVIEDHALHAIALESLLRDGGFDVIGPARTLDEALTALRDETPDCAVVDLNLKGQCTFALADILTMGSTPFVFLSAYGPEILPARFQGRPYLQKPYTPSDLLRSVEALGHAKTCRSESVVPLPRLARVDAELGRARQRTECQRALVRRTSRDGLNLAGASELLAMFDESLRLLEDSRSRLLKALARS
jgi:CheY-like chemotaxis protein